MKKRKAFELDPHENTLHAEDFLNSKYVFRRNTLSGKTEYAEVERSEKEENLTWEILTDAAMNSIIVHAKRSGLDDLCKPKTEIKMLLNSDLVSKYNPITDFLENLPKWDGEDYVGKLFERLPGVNDEQKELLRKWLRSTVAHWLQMDKLHANECVMTLIGAQGCGKSTFVARLLPEHLREYYLDHLNLSNKFDKEMALTNNLLVNLDELDAIKPSQHAALKQTLSKSKVNGRMIYGKTQEDRPRYASFSATTNNPHPLTDITGSRRYICIAIPKGMYVDNTGEISYEQLYAQVTHELREQKMTYWFDNKEVDRIQEMNNRFLDRKEISEIMPLCFRPSKEGEDVTPLGTKEIIDVITNNYLSVEKNHSTEIKVGQALKQLGYIQSRKGNARRYDIVPLG